MKVNETWHTAHRMPEGESFEQRVAWHAEHSEACGCRPIPEDVRVELRRRGDQTSDKKSASGRTTSH